MRRFALLCGLVLMLGAQGCVVLPATKKTIAGTEIDVARLQFIKPGVTTRSQVIQQLGPPHSVFEDIGVLAYSWEVGVGYAAWYPLESQTIGQPYLLLVEWDEAERVRRFETIKRGSADTVRSQAVAWAKAGGSPPALALPTQFAPVSVPSGKSVILVFRPGGFEVPFVAIRVALDNEDIADLRSKEYASLIAPAGSHSITLQPHSLLSGSGSLDLAVVNETLVVDALTNQASYVQVKVPAGHDRLVPHSKIVPENEALLTLRKLRPW